jgi:hypothetical protein
VSYHLHPHARRVTSPSWVLERRLLLRLRRCSAAAGCATMRAWRAVTALACAVNTGRASALGMGHAPLCNWAERGFGPVAVELVFHFLNIFKFLQI